MSLAAVRKYREHKQDPIAAIPWAQTIVFASMLRFVDFVVAHKKNSQGITLGVLFSLVVVFSYSNQAGTIWTFTVTGWTRLPLTPQIVIGTVLFAAYFVAESEIETIPLERLLLLIDALTFDGNPLTERLTVP